MKVFKSLLLISILSLPNAVAINHYLLSESHFVCFDSETHIHQKIDECFVDNFTVNFSDFDFSDNIDKSDFQIENSLQILFSDTFHTKSNFYNFSLRGPPII